MEASVEQAASGPWRKDICASLLILQAAGLLMLGVWLMFAGLSIAPFQNTGFTWGLALRCVPVWLFPAVPLVSFVAAWRAFRRGSHRRAVAWSVVPLVAALPMLVLVALSRVM